MVENTSGTIYTAAATDTQGQAITFSISGGADATRFAITSAGALSFAGTPNFEAPTDANGDNVYEVTLSASDGAASSTLNLTVTVTNSKEGIQVRRVATGFSNAAAISMLDANRLLIAEQGGAVYLLDLQTNTRTFVVQVSNVGPTGVGGVQAIMAPPDFDTTGIFYVLYTNPENYLIFLRYLRNVALTVPDNFGPIFAILAPGYAGGGWIGRDGSTLYVATADGGESPSTSSAAQDPNSRLGKLLSLTPNYDPYAGAAPNSGFAVRVAASGLHSPRGGDVVTGGIYLADRGQTYFDEIDLFPFPSPAGGWGNYGWPVKEGTQLVGSNPPAGLIDPVTQYPRGAAAIAGQGIIGAVNYRGTITSLIGSFIMIDVSGKVFTVSANTLVAGTTVPTSGFQARTLDFVPDVGSIDRPRAIAEDAVGNIIILDDDGEIFRLAANGS